jgi:hypothetical protein
MTLSARIAAGGAATACSRGLASEGCRGLRPQDVHGAYALPTAAPNPQTIAIVDAYDDPTAEQDLKVYDHEFKLSRCTVRNHCFRKINQEGNPAPLPAPNGGWAEEISLDVEIAHATCQRNCRILLVEAKSESPTDLAAAEERAVAAGATEISNSWAEIEPVSDSPAFDHPGIVITAASGDEGYLSWASSAPQERGLLLSYPASSPHVVAVGGTRLYSAAGTWNGEIVWNGDGVHGAKGATGGGCSERFSAPFWQQELSNWSAVGCGAKRAVADLAADADPHTGAAIYDSTPNEEGFVPGWQAMGGTSLSSPLIAATFALAGGAGGVEYPARTLYENELRAPASLHDVESGSSGECKKLLASEELSACTASEEAASCAGRAICLAGPGYDGPSGVGTPNGIGAFQPTGAPIKQAQVIEFSSSIPAAARLHGPSYTVSASASSGLAVSYSAGTPAVCSLSGATVSFIGVGTCTIIAGQPGDSEYRAAQAQQSFAVGRGAQLIFFTSIAPGAASVGGPPYTVAASASSGLEVTFTSLTPAVCSLQGATASFIGVGTCTIEARQAGDSEWEAAPEAEQSVAVAPKSTPLSGTLSFTAPFTRSPPNSSFSLLANPRIDRRSGAVTFLASVANPGGFSWLLTFPNGKFGVVQARAARCGARQIKLRGSCRPARIVFARGSRAVIASGTVSFSIKPSALALKALALAAKRGQGLLVTATLSYKSALGGPPVTHTRSFSDRLESAHKTR